MAGGGRETETGTGGEIQTTAGRGTQKATRGDTTVLFFLILAKLSPPHNFAHVMEMAL